MNILNNIKINFKKLMPDIALYNYHYMRAKKKKKRKSLIFEVHIVEHCNLNCKACNNFSCLSDKSFLDIVEFEHDLKRLKEIFGERVEQIQLLGGEPLLADNLSDFCMCTRKIFSKAKIKIVTNGTLLMKQSDILYKVCRECNISFSVTRYPISFDYDSAKKFIENKGIDIDYGNIVEKTMSIFPVDPYGSKNPKKSFAICDRANNCISLKHGKLYTCTMIPNIYLFNKTFNEQIPVTENDYIDIYKENDADKILRRLVKPFPICAYCDPGHIINGIKWSVTKREKSEWVIRDDI